MVSKWPQKDCYWMGWMIVEPSNQLNFRWFDSNYNGVKTILSFIEKSKDRSYLCSFEYDDEDKVELTTFFREHTGISEKNSQVEAQPGSLTHLFFFIRTLRTEPCAIKYNIKAYFLYFETKTHRHSWSFDPFHDAPKTWRYHPATTYPIPCRTIRHRWTGCGDERTSTRLTMFGNDHPLCSETWKCAAECRDPPLRSVQLDHQVCRGCRTPHEYYRHSSFVSARQLSTNDILNRKFSQHTCFSSFSTQVEMWSTLHAAHQECR